MIDTKIACQCGNRFKFGMDLVNGRAPDGLVCPTCGAPATPACNALVDFLSGKEPPAIGTGSRPLKEIRVVCACGARYKFDLELAEKEMPGAVTCPGCQADLTPLANEEIRTYIAKHAADLALPAAAPVPAPTTAAAPEPTAQPVSATPTSPLPPPAVTSALAPASPAPPSEVAANASAPASPPPVVPEASPAAAPAVPSPAAATAPVAPAVPSPSVTPVSDPFGPTPTGKSSGPNLKPLDVPRPNRPPPGSKPAAPPAKPAGPAAPAPSASPAKPAAKPGAKPAAAPVAARGEPSLGLGVTGAVLGAVLGGALWFALLKITGRPGAYMAMAVGSLAGFGARTLGRGASPVLGGVACVATFAISGVMVWLALGRHIDGVYAPRLEAQYKAKVDQAQAAVNAKTDADLRPFVAQTMPIADLEGAKVSDEAIKAFRETRLPQLRAFLADKDARAKFEAEQLRLNRSAYPLEDAWDETFGIFGLLFILAGVIGAAKLGLK